MAELIPFYIPKKYKPRKYKWVPVELRGKIFSITERLPSDGVLTAAAQFYCPTPSTTNPAYFGSL